MAIDGGPAELGTLLFEQRRGRPLVLGTLLVIAGGITLLGVYSLEGAFNRITILILGSGPLLYGVWGIFSRIRFFARGIEKSSLFGTHVLRYEDVDVLEYSPVGVFIHGAYAGTSIKITLRPARDRAIVWNTTVIQDTRPFESLRDQVAKTIGARLLGQIQWGESVRWGSAHLTPEGLRCQPSHSLRSGPEILLPYSGELGWRFVKNGRLEILDGEKPVRTLECREPNFYPGLLVLGQLVAKTRRS